MSEGTVRIPQGLLEALRAARQVAVLTGAGVSAESGVPTFRDAMTGLWARYDPLELATPEAFERNPALVWNWYAWRRELVSRAAPNPAHHALAAMARHYEAFTLITQNVDALHRRAGSEDVLELHGNLLRTRCHACERVAASSDESGPVPPRCPACGGLLRPDVVWFGEPLPHRELARALEAAQAADVFLSVGTSSLVHPAAAIPQVAHRAGATLVEVNPTPTPLSPLAHHRLEARAGEILPVLLTALEA